jgi:amino acid adenylation domain-containing protein
MHHIASDGWSNGIIVRELSELYRAHIQRRTHDLPKLQIQYSDYAIWQRNYLTKEKLNQKLAYWKQKLSNTTPLELPTDYPRPALQSTKGAVAQFKIDKTQTEKLNQLSKQQGTTLFMTMLAAFKVLLYRYTGQTDITVGTPTAGRQQKEVEDLIGFFINTLALRTELNEEAGFTDNLKKVKDTAMEAFANQDVPFEKIVEQVVTERDLSRSPLFQVMFVFQNTPEVPEIKMDTLQLKPADIDIEKVQFELILTISENKNGLNGSFQFCTDIYKSETIERLILDFKTLLNSITENANSNIASINVLSEMEAFKVLHGFYKPIQNKLHSNNILQLFKEGVEAHPDAFAVVFEDQMLTYRELEMWSDKLANYLVDRGVSQEMLLPVCMSRGVEFVVAILGIMKAGGAYVPIDPEYPTERIKYIINDTKASLVLTDIVSQHKLPNSSHTAQNMVFDWDLLKTYAAGNLNLSIQETQAAYVIYTSGSTGNPKGVVVEHRQLIQSTVNRLNYYEQVGSILLIPSFAFDSSVAVIFWAITAGGKLVIASENALKEPGIMRHHLRYTDTILCVPSFYKYLLDEFAVKDAALKQVILAGENLPHTTVRHHFAQRADIELYNEYGPTENTVWTTVERIPNADEPVTIGKPLPEVQVIIADHHLVPKPIGAIGEICIGGTQVSRGYLNNLALTKGKFVANKYAKNDGGQLYRTGDMGRWLPDGKIEYLGRKDDQVKVRGYRIETGEIEANILSFDIIKDAVVTAFEDKNNQTNLAVYFVPKREIEIEDLKQHLREKLPEYMLPSIWIRLDKIPLTPHGKIDKKALPNPELAIFGSIKYVAPSTETEIQLAKIWEEILNVNRVGIHDNFFEIGGHSILALRLISRISLNLGVEISLLELMQNQTISKMAIVLLDKNKKGINSASNAG